MKIYIVSVDEDGRIVLSPELCGRLGVANGGRIVLVTDQQGVHLFPEQHISRPDDWLGTAPSGPLGELETIRHAGMDETELQILRAGPGARVNRSRLGPEAPSELETDQTPENDNLFLSFLGAA